MTHHVATFWYVDTPNPAGPIRSGVPSDPGFARRLLSRLFPTITVTSLGEFPLNRSASTGTGEIYIGSFPGLTVVQTLIEGPILPSEVDPVWRRLVDAPTVLVFCTDKGAGVNGFARWESGRLVRSFAGSADRIVEDEGVPLPFERPFWAGEFPIEGAASNPLALPFEPARLLHAAYQGWLGFDLDQGGLDVPVHGFAVDGRREVRQRPEIESDASHLLPLPSRAERHAAALRAADQEDFQVASPFEEDEYERATPVVNKGAGTLHRFTGAVGEVMRRSADSVSRLRRGQGNR